jgi:hypothetical protein
MILVDTSVWIDHFRRSNPRLQALVDDRALLIHPVVIGELACGTIRNRKETLLYLQAVPRIPSIADAEETMFVIESRNLSGKGIGWVDAQLIASALISGCRLWSNDRNLHAAAAALRIAY